MKPANGNDPAARRPPRYYFLCGMLAGIVLVFAMLVALHALRTAGSP